MVTINTDTAGIASRQELLIKSSKGFNKTHKDKSDDVTDSLLSQLEHSLRQMKGTIDFMDSLHSNAGGAYTPNETSRMQQIHEKMISCQDELRQLQSKDTGMGLRGRSSARSRDYYSGDADEHAGYHARPSTQRRGVRGVPVILNSDYRADAGRPSPYSLGDDEKYFSGKSPYSSAEEVTFFHGKSRRRPSYSSSDNDKGFRRKSQRSPSPSFSENERPSHYYSRGQIIINNDQIRDFGGTSSDEDDEKRYHARSRPRQSGQHRHSRRTQPTWREPHHQFQSDKERTAYLAEEGRRARLEERLLGDATLELRREGSFERKRPGTNGPRPRTFTWDEGPGMVWPREGRGIAENGRRSRAYKPSRRAYADQTADDLRTQKHLDRSRRHQKYDGGTSYSDDIGAPDKKDSALIVETLERLTSFNCSKEKEANKDGKIAGEDARIVTVQAATGQSSVQGDAAKQSLGDYRPAFYAYREAHGLNGRPKPTGTQRRPVSHRSGPSRDKRSTPNPAIPSKTDQAPKSTRDKSSEVVKLAAGPARSHHRNRDQSQPAGSSTAPPRGPSPQPEPQSLDNSDGSARAPKDRITEVFEDIDSEMEKGMLYVAQSAENSQNSQKS